MNAGLQLGISRFLAQLSAGTSTIQIFFITIMYFKIANQLFREKKYYEAALIYGHLESIIPYFPYYGISKNAALEKFSETCGGKKPKLRWSSETDENYLLKLSDGIVQRLSSLNPEIENFLSSELQHHVELPLLQANMQSDKNQDKWLEKVNKWLLHHRLRPAHFINRNDPRGVFYQIGFKSEPIRGGDKVSIIMSCFNSEKTIEFAVNSILNQDYENIELIIFDDNSSDGTKDVLARLAATDSRIIPNYNKINRGTYNNRNSGIQQSSGRYVTVMDADDLCHPQRIAIQVRCIENRSNSIAVLADWVRMNFEGRFIYKNAWTGGYQHEAVATLLFDKERIVSKIGYYDGVRFGADSEYLSRIRKVFGKDSVFHLKTPLLIASSHEESLTANVISGVSNIFGSSEIRKRYKKSWEKWHADSENLYISNSQENRIFDAPLEMLIAN